MDITITLTAAEQAALLDLLTQAQDPTLTITGLISTLVHNGLGPQVAQFLSRQNDVVLASLAEMDYDTRTAITEEITKPRILPVKL